MRDVLKRIKPTKEEEKEFSKITNDLLKIIKISDTAPVLGGSAAKGTWLSGNHDIDIFVRFDYQKYKDKSHQIAEILEKSLKKNFPKEKIRRLHGSRDYFTFQYNGYNVETIPILNISKAEKAVNITDVSPLHTKWVNKESKKIKDDILLAKQFCKANNLYGAESYIAGFSGYVLEIITANYGSFENLLKAAVKWQPRVIIDPAKHYKKKEALFHINSSKLHAPLIIIDPVDKTRNAAAALSKEKFILFKKLARSYLKKPAASFFVKKGINLEKIKKEAQKKKLATIFLKVTPLKGKPDVVGSKLLKAFSYFNKNLSSFVVKKAAWEWEQDKKALMYFLVEKKELPAVEIREGPPLKLKEAVKAFKKKHKQTFVKGSRIKAKVNIKHRQIEDFINQTLKEKYVQDRIKKAEFID